MEKSGNVGCPYFPPIFPEWSTARNAAYIEWDEIKISRETAVEQFGAAYEAEILHMIDIAQIGAAMLPGSFTVRLKIVGRGLKDFVLNYPYIFEVVEPEDISLPQHSGHIADQGLTGSARVARVPPYLPNAPDALVCSLKSMGYSYHGIT